MTFREQVKESWEKDNKSPPVAHMEEYTLTRLAADFKGISLVDLLKILKDSNIQMSGTDVTLKTIAAENEITPATIYEILNRKYSSNTVINKSEGLSGMGKMTLNEIALRLETKESKLISIVKANGIDATVETTIRIIADQLGITPNNLYSFLTDN